MEKKHTTCFVRRPFVHQRSSSIIIYRHRSSLIKQFTITTHTIRLSSLIIRRPSSIIHQPSSITILYRHPCSLIKPCIITTHHSILVIDHPSYIILHPINHPSSTLSIKDSFMFDWSIAQNSYTGRFFFQRPSSTTTKRVINNTLNPHPCPWLTEFPHKTFHFIFAPPSTINNAVTHIITSSASGCCCCLRCCFLYSCC